MKISITGITARDKALQGAKYVGEAVKSTIGPFGLNAFLEKGNRPTNDGFLISRELVDSIENEFERKGAVVLHETSSQTNDEVGDATSSTEALCIAIAEEAIKLLPKENTLVAKKKASEVDEMIQASKDNVIQKLSEMKTPVETVEQLIESARVSVENKELAEMLGKAQWEIGKDGFIIIEETQEDHCSISIQKGIRLDNGFGTSIMINNHTDQALEVENASVILTNQVVQLDDLLGLRTKIFDPLLLNKKQDKLVIIARGFSAEAIKLCADSHAKGFFLFPVNAPFTDSAEIMKDLQAVSGARYIDVEESTLADIQMSDLGFFKKLVARRHDAIVTGDENDMVKEKVQKRAEQLQEKMKGSISEFERRSLESRISQLNTGFAILKVGAPTPQRRKYFKDKCDDAVMSVRNALREGTVKGAGIAFKEIAETLPDEDILKRPIQVINDTIMASAPKEYVVEEWVRDPYLTLVSALENACQGAITLATTNILVATKNDEKCCHQKKQEESNDA